MSQLLDLEAMRSQFLHKDFDEQTFSVDAEKLAAYARACGEIAERYVNPADPDFQAPPTFPSSLSPGRRLPDGFPKLPGMGMDAGKAVAPLLPIRAGTTITARTHLHEVYRKTGRSGHMTFLVTRMELFNEAGDALATADTRVVIREKPDGSGE